MTTTITKDPRFGLITGFGGPVRAAGTVALGGVSQKIYLSAVVAGVATFLGESEDLGGEVLAVDASIIEEEPTYYRVLTSNGLVLASYTNTPTVVSTHAFNPGGGRWVELFGLYLATPLHKGGVQVMVAATGEVVATHLSGRQSSQFAAADSSSGRLWVVDHLSATLSTFTVSDVTGELVFTGSINAPNCRDVLKVVVDIGGENLFVLCRNRIVRFTIPADQDTPVFAQDYGVSATPYTDFLVLEADKYWVGQASSRLPSPLDAYYGQMFGAWNPQTDEMQIAAPASSVWTVSNVVPYYDAETLEETIVPPAQIPPPPDQLPPFPVIAPAPPVITSALTSSVVEGTPFSYTITATGTGPIFYDVVSPPGWITSINHLTGVVTGIAPPYTP